MRSILRWLGRSLLSLLTALLLIGAGLYAHYLWSGPELRPWHRARLAAEFTADDYADGRVTTLRQYQAREQQLLDEVRSEITAQLEPRDRRMFNRFAPGSRSNPQAWPRNWNLTFVLEPAAAAPVGGVLLLHGLTDSPYSLRSIGEVLARDGYRVVGLRLPGHGMAPSGLVHFEMEDLEAAARLAMRDIRTHLAPDQPIAIIGYSNGAAVAVNYALDTLDDASLPRPSQLVLISPAIGITRLAALARIRTGLSDVQGFGRAAWQTIEPEVDPYKLQSFPFNAAGVTQRLTSTLASRIARLAEHGPVRGLPPILAFVSTVDSTVQAAAIPDTLLNKLAPEGHELVLFDVNRLSAVQPLLVSDPGPLTAQLVAQPQRPYALSVITNVDEHTDRVEERRVPAGRTVATHRPLEATWPRNVFSLSHVALPFPPDDPLYGYAAPRDERHVQLGRIEVRGENGVLAIPRWMLTRQRSNPFHAYLVSRIEDALHVPHPAVEALPAAAAQAVEDTP